jgi:hypothetical protein
VYPRLWVHLATAARPVRVRASDVEAFILGTDFTYDDLRTWTPRFVTAARHPPVFGDDFLGVTGRWRYRERKRVSGNGRIAVSNGLVVTAMWSADRSPTPFKMLHTEGVSVIDGVSMPEIVTVERPYQGYTSSMELCGARIGPVAGARLFDPERLRVSHGCLDDLAECL